MNDNNHTNDYNPADEYIRDTNVPFLTPEEQSLLDQGIEEFYFIEDEIQGPFHSSLTPLSALTPEEQAALDAELAKEYAREVGASGYGPSYYEWSNTPTNNLSAQEDQLEEEYREQNGLDNNDKP